jgi:hypothetical protein
LVSKYEDYNDERIELNERAWSYLNINCSLCHRPEGSTKTSGLDLSLGHNDLFSLGVNKPPVAVGG